ncbi:MAG: threonine ammonia-lyase [Gemmatimonadota bacterium]|nr:MAG: threonine ammonia-lyase [Gemmatimonadota bacterium]
MRPIDPIDLTAIREARERIRGIALRTPLIRLDIPDAPAEIYLKLENLQPIGSFKLRGAGNAMALAGSRALARGVYTASAGNMAQGVAWNARRLGVPCHVVVPDHAPKNKLDAIARLGGEAIPVPYEDWWRVIQEHEYPDMDGLFIHPVSDPAVIAGNGTIGLEILEDLPDVDAVVVPYGGGGLSCGIASAVKALKPDALVFASEVATAAPFAASLREGSPQEVDRVQTFVDGIGGKSVLPEMWPLASSLLDGSLVMSIEAVVDAIRTLAIRARVIAEGAGATPVAAALDGRAGTGKVVCVVSGGNIDTVHLVKILEGGSP